MATPGRGIWVSVALAVGFALLAAPSSARAQDLSAALARYLEADFEAAGAAFGALLERPDLDPRTALEAHRHLAAITLVMGDEAAARRHAEAAVALGPSTAPPEGAPTELAGLLERVRAEQGDARASLSIEAPGGAVWTGAATTVTARLAPAPPALAARLALRCSGPQVDAVAAAGPPPAVEVEVEASRGATLARCEARAETAAGAALLERVETFPVERGHPPGSVAPDDPTPSTPSWIRRRWPWVVGIGGGAILAAAVVTVAVLAAPSPTEAALGPPRVEGW